MIVTLGIDPSLTATALCCIENGEPAYWHEYKPKAKGMERLDWLFSKVSDVTGGPFVVKRPPINLIAIEGYSYASAGRAVINMGELGGILRLLLYWSGHMWLEVAPPTLKKFATGKGNAPKDSIMLQVYKRWGFEAESNNVADAFVLSKIAYHLASKDRAGLADFQTEILDKLEEKLCHTD